MNKKENVMIQSLKLTVLAALVAVMAATAAHADTINLTLLAPTTSYAGGAETFTYDASVMAPSTNGADVYLNGDSLNVNAPLMGNDLDFYLNFPLSLSPGNSFTDDLFTVTVPSGTASGLYDGSFVLLGGSDGGALNDLASANFAVSVPPAAVTPEPSSLALLTLGMLAVGVIVAKRRGFRYA